MNVCNPPTLLATSLFQLRNPCLRNFRWPREWHCLGHPPFRRPGQAFRRSHKQPRSSKLCKLKWQNMCYNSHLKKILIEAECSYHDQINVLIARRPIWWPNLLMTWLRTKSIQNMPFGQIWREFEKIIHWNYYFENLIDNQIFWSRPKWWPNFNFDLQSGHQTH